MKTKKFLAEISREFFKKHNITRYGMKKVSEMSDDDVITACHYFYEENKLNEEWWAFREKKESEHIYCPYLKEFIDVGMCTDIQMISNNLIKDSALPEIKIDKEYTQKMCKECEHCL